MSQQCFKRCFPGPISINDYEELKTSDSDDEDFGDKTVTTKSEAANSLLSPYTAANIGIMASYFCVGVLSRLTQTPVQYYLIEYLGASATQYSAYATLRKLLEHEIIFRISDGLPIIGYRRKSWLLVGWSCFIILNWILIQIFTPGINQTIFLNVGFTICMVMADMCTDTLCVERARYETDKNRGSIQATGFIYRSFGRILGAVLGTYLYDNGTSWSFDISQIYILNAAMPIACMGLVFWPMIEIKSDTVVTKFSDQMSEVWRVLQLRAVWHPFIFVYVFNALQIPNSASANFLVYGLNFTDAQLGYLNIMAAVVGCVAFMIFKLFFFNTSWRQIYIIKAFINFLYAAVQIILILRLNQLVGVSDTVLAVLAEGVLALMEGVYSMPIIIMSGMLCDNGAEGTTFALLTTVGLLAATVANDFGTWLLLIWDVSNDTLAAGDYSGMLNLSLLTTILQVLPIFLVGLLPDSTEEHQKEIDRGLTNWWGGVWMTFLISSALVLTICLNLVYLF